MKNNSWPSHFLFVGVWCFLHGALYYYVVETEKSNSSFSLSWAKQESNNYFFIPWLTQAFHLFGAFTPIIL